MNIARITTTKLRVPFTEPPATGFLPLTAQDLLVVTVTLTNNVSGMGYLHPLLGGLHTLETCVHEMLVPHLNDAPIVDADGACRVPDIWQQLFDATYIQGRMGVTVMAQSAIDIALWDAYAKCNGEPLYAALGGQARNIPIYGSGCFRGLGQTGMIAKAKGYLDEGFNAVKMQAAHTFTPSQDVANVAAMRQALGDQAHIMVDINQGWDTHTAVETGRLLEDSNPYWLEEPVIAHDFDGYRTIADAVRSPIVGGENHFTHLDLQPLIDMGLPYLQPDVMRGGISNLLYTAERCAAQGIQIAPHLFHELMAHLLAAIPNAGWLEYMGWHDALWVEPLHPENGVVMPREQPGHGLQFKPEVLDKFVIA